MRLIDFMLSSLVRGLLLFSFISSFFFLSATPVRIDEILSERNKLRLNTQISYLNLQNKTQTPTSIPYQLSDGNFITIPTIYLESKNQDLLNLNLSLRYGITDRIEIFSSISGYYQHSTITDIYNNFQHKNYGNFNNWNLGFIFEAKKEGDFPSLLLGFSTDLLNLSIFQDQEKLGYINRYNIFLSSFYTIDPIVLFLQANFYFSLQDHFQNTTLDYGKIFVLNPMIYFAVNPYISLNFGVKYSYKSADKINHKVIAIDGSSIGYNLGISYEITPKTFLFIDAEYSNTNSYTSNNINLNFLFKI